MTSHNPSHREIADLLNLADRDLEQCQLPGLKADWRLAIAYNAALQCAIAALAAEGYRAVHEAHHYRVIQSLEFTIGWPCAEIEAFNTFRRQRHRASYERTDTTSEQDAHEMLNLAHRLRVEVESWLAVNHPDL